MHLFLVFHHNLAFSSVPVEHYPYIIDSVYTKLLDLAESGYPLGLEFTGETLETIEKINPDYITRLASLLNSKSVELIGSSYSQAIFPLIPCEVNKWNLSLGLDVYQRLLGQRPSLAYLNEQCYSDSLIELYRDSGYKAILFDWMNAVKDNPWPDHYRYRLVKYADSGVSFLWNDCIAFQKFQRAIWGDIDFSDLQKFVRQHLIRASRYKLDTPYLCLYCSDAEVFDYRPGTLNTSTGKTGQIKRIESFLDRLKEDLSVTFLLPSQIIHQFQENDCPLITGISTPSYPVRTKKQEKYNVTRWAVTGREATRMNTQCFQLYRLLGEIEEGSLLSNSETARLRKNLVKLWGSDYRTHTTDEKYEAFRHLMGESLAAARTLLRRGKTSKAITSTTGDKRELTPGAGRETVGKQKEDAFRFHLNAFGFKLSLLKNKGLAIEKLYFPGMSDLPLLGTIPHGSFPDIALGSDYFSGHSILITQDAAQYTDLSFKVRQVESFKEKGKIHIRNRTPIEIPGLSIIKTFIIDSAGLQIVYDFYARDLRPASLRMGIWTIMPHSFDRDSLYVKTCLGGSLPESFKLAGSKILQDQPANHIVTARHCLGCTDGRILIGDNKKELAISVDQAQLYSVPLLHYEECLSDCMDDPAYLCRIYFSLCERDDVANVFWKGRSRLSFRITSYPTGNIKNGR